MTPIEALKLIAQVVSTLTFKLSDTAQAVKIQEALQVLGDALKETKE